MFHFPRLTIPFAKLGPVIQPRAKINSADSIGFLKDSQGSLKDSELILRVIEGFFEEFFKDSYGIREGLHKDSSKDSSRDSHEGERERERERERACFRRERSMADRSGGLEST